MQEFVRGCFVLESLYFHLKNKTTTTNFHLVKISVFQSKKYALREMVFRLFTVFPSHQDSRKIMALEERKVKLLTVRWLNKWKSEWVNFLVEAYSLPPCSCKPEWQDQLLRQEPKREYHLLSFCFLPFSIHLHLSL